MVRAGGVAASSSSVSGAGVARAAPRVRPVAAAKLRGVVLVASVKGGSSTDTKSKLVKEVLSKEVQLEGVFADRDGRVIIRAANSEEAAK